MCELFLGFEEVFHFGLEVLHRVEFFGEESDLLQSNRLAFLVHDNHIPRLVRLFRIGRVLGIAPSHVQGVAVGIDEEFDVVVLNHTCIPFLFFFVVR